MTLVLAAVSVLGIAPGVARLTLRTDGHALVPINAPEIALDRSIRDEFGIEDPIVVVIKTEHPRGIFNAATLRLVLELTKAFQEIEGVRNADVFSLATEHGHRVYPGTLKFRRFLDPLPESEKLLETLREDLRRIRLYNGTLVSDDERSTTIMVGTPYQSNRVALVQTIRGIIDAQQSLQDEEPWQDELVVIGAPVAEALLGTHLLEDLGVPEALLGRTNTMHGDDQHATPRSVYELRTWIARHVGLVPVAILIMALVFMVTFRSVTAAALPLMEVGAAIVFVFALMGWCGVPVYLTIAVLPVILTATGVADEIHIFTQYRDLLRSAEGREHVAVVRATMDEMWRPVVKTSVTTSVGFLSFGLSTLGPVRAFGIFTAVGVCFCMLWSLTVIPALLTLIPPRWLVGSRRTKGHGHGIAADARVAVHTRVAGSRVGALVAILLRRRREVLIVVAVLVLLTPLGVRQIRVQDSWIDGFAASSKFYRDTQFFNEHFLGTHLLLVVVTTEHESITGTIAVEQVDHHTLTLPASRFSDPQRLVGQYLRMLIPDHRTRRPAGDTGPPPMRERNAWVESVKQEGDKLVITIPRISGSPLMGMHSAHAEHMTYEIASQRFVQPRTIKIVEGLTEFIRDQSQYAVGGALGTAGFLKTTNLMKRGLNEEGRVVPRDPKTIKELWAHYKRIRGADRLRQVVDEDFGRGIVTVYLKNANFEDTAKLMAAIRTYERDHLRPEKMSLCFAGDVAVSQTLIGAIVKTQVESLLLSLVGIMLVASMLGGGLRFGVLAVIPCALAVLVNFSIMGLSDMPLGVATSMFAGMTLGIGVDYAIHLLERFRRSRLRGLGVDDSIVEAVRTTGPAVIIDAVAVALGFGIMTLSQVPANARLGGLVVLSIVGCLLSTLVLLPALLKIWPPKTVVNSEHRG